MKTLFWFLVIFFIAIMQNFVANVCIGGGGGGNDGLSKIKNNTPTSKPAIHKSNLPSVFNKTKAKQNYQNQLPNEFKFAQIKHNDIYALVVNGDNDKNSKDRHQNNVALAYKYFMSIGMSPKNICLIGYQNVTQQKTEPRIKNINQCLMDFGKQIASKKNKAGFVVYFTGHHGTKNLSNKSSLALTRTVKKQKLYELDNDTIEKTEYLNSSDFRHWMRIYIPAQTFVVYIGDQCFGSDFPKYLEKIYFQGFGFSLSSENQYAICKEFSPAFWKTLISGKVSFATALNSALEFYQRDIQKYPEGKKIIPKPTIRYFPQSLNVGQINYGTNSNLPIPQIEQIVKDIYKRSFTQFVAIEVTLTTCPPYKKLKKDLPEFLFGYNGEVHWVRIEMPDTKTNLSQVFGWLNRTISDFPKRVYSFPTIFLIKNGKVDTFTPLLWGIKDSLKLSGVVANKLFWGDNQKFKHPELGYNKKSTTKQEPPIINSILSEKFNAFKKYNPNFSPNDIMNLLNKFKITPTELNKFYQNGSLSYDEIKCIIVHQLPTFYVKKLKQNDVPIYLWYDAFLKKIDNEMLFSYYRNLSRITHPHENPYNIKNIILSAIERKIPYTKFVGFPDHNTFTNRYNLYTNYWISGWWYQNFPGIANELIWAVNKFDQKSVLYIVILMLISFFFGSRYRAFICWFKIRALKKEIMYGQNKLNSVANHPSFKHYRELIKELAEQKQILQGCLQELKTKEPQIKIIIIKEK